MARFVSLIVALGLFVAGFGGVSAADTADEYSVVRGTVRSESGGGAIGACVWWGSEAVSVAPDGTFEVRVLGDHEGWVWFRNCLIPHDVYPYEDLYYNSQEWVTVAAGDTRTISATLPLKEDGPPELGAITGTLSDDRGGELGSRVVYLMTDDGTTYGFGSLFDDEFRAAAPAGDYRLFVARSGWDTEHVPAFYGDHPRGFALTWDEASTVTIGGPRDVVTGIDIVVPVGTSHEASARSARELTTSGPGWPNGPARAAMWVEAGAEYARIGIAVDADAGDPPSLGDAVVWAYPTVRGLGTAWVQVWLHENVLPNLEDPVPVWLNFSQLAACQLEDPGPCLEAQEVEERYHPETYEVIQEVRIDIRGTSGGEFRFGPRPQFYDAADSVFGGDILWLADSGITKGCNPPGNDLFCPDEPVTRGQMAAFLVRALGLTEQLDNPFGDDDGSIFEASIEKLAAAGITKGCNPPVNDLFCPDDPVTRGQMAAFMVRALKLTDSGTTDFVDDNGTVFESHIEKLAAAGITRGCNPPVNDRFCPEATVTRGQMAAFLHRALG